MIAVTKNVLATLDFESYRKNPVTIKATKMPDRFCVETLEGAMCGNAGDYLIVGVEGEAYPCREDIFKKTYTRVGTVFYDPNNYSQGWIMLDD